MEKSIVCIIKNQDILLGGTKKGKESILARCAILYVNKFEL